MKNFNTKGLHQSIFMKKCDRVQKTNLTIFEPLGVHYPSVNKKIKHFNTFAWGIYRIRVLARCAWLYIWVCNCEAQIIEDENKSSRYF